MLDELHIQRVVVLGAGVMGSQIAATLANAGLEVSLLDLEHGGDPSGCAKLGIGRALNARPSAFFLPEYSTCITPGGLDDLEPVASADWVIEAIVEEMEAKRALLARIDQVLKVGSVVSTNTSGLSIARLAEGRSPYFASAFLGTHFFNPPRHMKLVEVVPGVATNADIVAQMGRFLTATLGREVVVARDTPNFIANRLGIFAIMDMLHRMDEQGLHVELVDGLTGPLLGRPRSGTLRLCDIIGLDILADVARTAYEQLLDDPMRNRFLPSPTLQRMLEAGWLGVKSGGGFYRKVGGTIQALDPQSMEYRDQIKLDYGELDNVLKTPKLPDRLGLLWEHASPLASLLRAHMTTVLTYAANNAHEVAADLSQIDCAMCAGFSWQAGPFELWDMIGTELISKDEEKMAPMVSAAKRLNGGLFYRGCGPSRHVLETTGASMVSCDDSRSFLGEASILSENDEACLMDVGDGIGVLQFRGKMNAIGFDALAMAYEAANGEFNALVVCGDGELFSIGANLKLIASMSNAEDWQSLDQYLCDFQNSIRALQCASFPVVAAPHGLALGGGCEFCIGADVRLAAAELRIGLVETKVGLIPGGGGCMEMARRFGENIEEGFHLIFRGQFTDNAHEARSWGFLKRDDRITMDESGLLATAIAWACDLAENGYRPATVSTIKVAGVTGLEQLEGWLCEQEEAGAITAYDRVVGASLARVLCGGDRNEEKVEEGEILDLERAEFLRLCGNKETRQRIDHMLRTGKPLRN